ncbi:MAG: hypothetical protein V4750_09765 [Pseudomonadota bacterium]
MPDFLRPPRVSAARLTRRAGAQWAAASLWLGAAGTIHAATQTLLNVSCDVSRSVDELFGGWKKAQKEHFDDGGLYDQIVATAKR